MPNRRLKNVANVVLLLTKVFDIKVNSPATPTQVLNLYSHFAIDDQFERMAPSLVFFFMLVCRMVVDWQFDKIPEEPKVATSSDHLILKKTKEDAAPVEVEGNYDEVPLRPSLPRQAKNKRD